MTHKISLMAFGHASSLFISISFVFASYLTCCFHKILCMTRGNPCCLVLSGLAGRASF